MGSLASGRKVDETADHVRYSFERFPGDPEAGVLAVPVADPEDGWTLDGTTSNDDDRPKSAVVVVVKAVRAFRRTGVWPDEVVYAS